MQFKDRESQLREQLELMGESVTGDQGSNPVVKTMVNFTFPNPNQKVMLAKPSSLVAFILTSSFDG